MVNTTSAPQFKQVNAMLSSTYGLLFPDDKPFAENVMVKSLRKAARRRTVDRPSLRPQQYYLVHLIFDELRRWGPSHLLARSNRAKLRSKAILLLKLDTACRAAELAGIIRGKVQLTLSHASLPVWWTKGEDRPKIDWLKAKAQPDDPDTCPVAALRAYLHTLPKIAQVPKSLDTTPVLGVKSAPVFLADRGRVRKPLTADRIGHLVKDVLSALFPGDGWTAHTTRGATTSLAVDLGVPFSTVNVKARWASEATFRRHYHRPSRYRESGERRWLGMEFEDIIRCPVSRL